MAKSKRKSKKRQMDPLENETGSSDEDFVASKQCGHLARGLNINQLRKSVKLGLSLAECEACLKAKELENVEDKTEPPKTNSETAGNEIEAENEAPEVSIWICLQCGHRGCGRNQQKHALLHNETPRSDPHTLAVNTSSWATWCYKCDDFVYNDSKRLTEAVEFLRKQAGLSGNALPVLKRSTSLALGENRPTEITEKVLNHSKSKDDKEEKKKTEVDDVLNCLPRVKGLTNLGNTCFMNSILQVLSQTHLLTQLLDLQCREGQTLKLRGGTPIPADPQSTSQERDEDSGVGSLDRDSPEDFVTTEPVEIILGGAKALTLSFSSFLKEMHCPAASTTNRKNSQSMVTPSNIYNQICKKSPQFRGFEQQDAHELLRHLLDGIRNEDIMRHRQGLLRFFNVPERTNAADLDPALRQKLKAYGRESSHTFIDSVFGGVLLSSIVCQTCKQSYQMPEPFMDLSLPIAEEKTPPGSKRKGESFDCLSPASPVTPRPSKHQLKKERKTKKIAARKGTKSKEKAADENKEEGETNKKLEEEKLEEKEEEEKTPDENREMEEDNENVEEVTNEKNDEKEANKNQENEETKEEEKMDENGNESKVDEDLKEKENEEEADEKEENDIFDNSGDESSDLSDADVEDNTLDELEKQIDELSISPANGQNEPEKCCPAKSSTQNQWIARSLCTLSPRYHSDNSQDFSIESCLNAFTAAELLTGNNKYGCESCTKLRGQDGKTVYSMATKQLLVLAPPAILTLQLKRFTSSGMSLRKVQRKVQFPLLLDLAPFCSAAAAGITTLAADQKQVLYSLYGVVEHSGRLSSGHYTAYVRVRPLNPSRESMTRFMQTSAVTSQDLEKLRNSQCPETVEEGSADREAYNPAGKWYYVSDSHVTEVSQERVLNSQAFLLFYERIL